MRLSVEKTYIISAGDDIKTHKTLNGPMCVWQNASGAKLLDLQAIFLLATLEPNYVEKECRTMQKTAKVQ